MIRSTLLRRTLVLVFSTVLLTALLTLGLYQVISPYVFANIKSEELLPKARLLAEYAAMMAKGELTERTLIPLIGNNSNQWDANVWLVDINGDTLISTRTNATGEQLSGTLPESLRSMVAQVLSGEEVVYTGLLSSFAPGDTENPDPSRNTVHPWQQGSLSIQPIAGEGHGTAAAISGDSDMVVVGVPIISQPYLYGAIVMAQPMTEVVGGMRSLTNVLVWSILFAILTGLPLAYWVARSLSRPMKQMRDVALAMAGGNFDVKADETMRGETGELAGALNYLSSELSNTITELSVERNRLRRTLNGLSEGIVAIDAAGRVTHANPAVYALFGTDPEASDPAPMDVVPNEAVWTLYDEVLTGSGHQVEDLHFDGRILRLSLSPLEDEEGHSRIAGVVGIFRDVTAAERLEQTRRDYVANVSHELRTPLTALRALIEPLHDGLVRDDAARDRAYTIILRETMRLSRLVNDMLELSRLQSGTLSLQKTNFDVTRLLREAIMQYRQTAEDMGQTLRLTLPEQPLPLVYGNSDRTEQVLVTLLDNAMKYTPEEGVIEVSAAQVGEELHITVADTGVGIPPEDLPHVFERFYKADKAHQTKGTGLGLAIAREILKQLGERVWVESPPGEGAAFTFTLRLAP